jgi:hypothetical protein
MKTLFFALCLSVSTAISPARAAMRLPDGPRRITLHATKSYDYGILQFGVNGKTAPKQFDGFREIPAPSGPIDLGVFEPKDGRFVLRAELVGSNPASKAPKYLFGPDCTVLSPAEEAWRPAPAPLMTRWAKEVSPENVWPEYPRPQMARTQWQSLNGLWQYAVSERAAVSPQAYAGEILVPFCIESALSGVGKKVQPQQALWYRREFQTPKKWTGQRILLHFDAADWETTVWLNGKQVGTHRGGYDRFTFDITDALTADGPQQLVVRVWDPNDACFSISTRSIGKPPSG